MNPNIIAVGYTIDKHIHLICNDKGLAELPEPIEMYCDGGGNLPNGVLIAFTKQNLVALSLLGVLSENDISGMAARMKQKEELA